MRRNFMRVAFADKVKEFAYRLNPWMRAPVPGGRGLYTFYSLAGLVDEIGWDEAKLLPEVRKFLQELGTEAGRATLGKKVWITAAFRSSPPRRPLVISDGRFYNEYEAAMEEHEIRWGTRNGFYALWLTRFGHEGDGHSSETDELRKYCQEVPNNGTVEELHLRLQKIVFPKETPHYANDEPFYVPGTTLR